ncbi:MAG: L-lactate permease [Vicinamibacteria bacterium]|nr:L-lactate permease [Vicinamibacteria bacterium]MBP9947065.1 L-lactate permease [Vicinamibacteria bacterium]
MTWLQTYAPLGDVLSSALVASSPVVVLLGLLAFFHARAHVAALAGLLAAWIVAVLVFGMPAPLATASAVYGAAYGLFPIGWIVLNAIFIYDVTVKTGQFEIVKRTIAGLGDDRRIQALLIAFSFGAFIEGAAGFGTPVAISGAMLIGLGFRPLEAAGLALIGNTAPVAFGALGTPIIALNAVTHLPLEQLSAMVGRQLPFFSVIVPFWLVMVMAGLKGMREVWPACLTAGLSFAITQFLVSNYHGPWLVDIAGAIVSMTSLLVLLRFWQPRNVWRFHHERETAAIAEAPPSRSAALRAFTPWILLTAFVFVWGLPQMKKALDGLSIVRLPVPYLDKAVMRVPPVVAKPEPEAAVFSLNWLSATGTGLFLAGLASGFFLRLSPTALLGLYGQTLWRVRTSLLTIAAMLALGYTTRYSGSDTSMGLAFASTGFLFPFFSPLLGWLGVALTGSDTSSNVLFGNLQTVTAQQIGVSPLLTAAANASGGVMGKMIDAQSIVVASVATGDAASPGDILRYVFFHSLALACLVGLLVLLQAYVFPWMVPGS